MKKIVLCLLSICFFSILIMGCGKNKKIEFSEVWPETGMGSMISPPESTSVIIYNDRPDYFCAEIISDSENIEESEEFRNEIIQECIEKGFTDEFVAGEKRYSYSYIAFNDQGYKVYVDNGLNSVGIKIYPPKEIGTYSWPETKNAENLPKPESQKGTNIVDSYYEFGLYIGDTTFEQFWEYVDKVKALGFEDLEKHPEDWKYYNYYEGYNLDGDYIYVEYCGYNIMYIKFSAYHEPAVWEP